MDVELSPEQPEPVAAAIAAALAKPAPAPDPWWQAGLEASLEPYPERSNGRSA